MEIDSPEGDKRTTRQTEEKADTSRVEVEEVAGNDSDGNTEESQIAPLRRGRSRLNAERQDSKEKLDQRIEEAIDKTLRSPMLAADADPAEAYTVPSRTNSADSPPSIKDGDMVVVKLDPRLYGTFIPPAERALKGRRGRRARAAPKRGAE